jgi:EAL domain-containing protein (putative c-di-GMP-specific phosphodiesterase class I)
VSSRSLLEQVLAPPGLTVLFQPVMEVHGKGFRLSSVESLVRGPKGSNLEPAEILFDYVRRKRQQVVMDRACVAAACAAAASLPASLDFSINVHAATLSRDPEFLMFLLDTAQGHALEPSRIMVEIVEHAPEWAGPGLAEALDALRHIGVRIALDDVGLGQSNFRMILDCRPDVFKIDSYFVKGCHADFYRQAVLESVAMLASRFGSRVVAEGVECREDVDTLARLGITFFQGHFFSPALASPQLADSGLLRKPA